MANSGYSWNGNNDNNNGTGRTMGVGYMAGVNSVSGATIPTIGGPPQAQPASGYSGPLASSSFFGEPFAVWLGAILVLFLLKFLSESPKTSINPAKIEIGGYNFLAIGVTSAVFTILFKVLFNQIQVPGVTEFANAL